jgi:hypothetical protein
MDGSRTEGLSRPFQRDVGSGHVALVENVLRRQAARSMGGVPMISDRPSGWAPRATRLQAGLSTDQPFRAAGRRSARVRPGWGGPRSGGNST